MPGQVIAATRQEHRRRRRATLLRVVAVLVALCLGLASAYAAAALEQIWVVNSIGP